MKRVRECILLSQREEGRGLLFSASQQLLVLVCAAAAKDESLERWEVTQKNHSLSFHKLKQPEQGDKPIVTAEKIKKILRGKNHFNSK